MKPSVARLFRLVTEMGRNPVKWTVGGLLKHPRLFRFEVPFGIRIVFPTDHQTTFVKEDRYRWIRVIDAIVEAYHLGSRLPPPP